MVSDLRFLDSTPQSLGTQFCVTSPSTSSGAIDGAFGSYSGNAKTDETLMDEFFANDSGLLDKVTRMKAHRRRHQPDDLLVRDYRLNIALYGTLMNHRWEVGAVPDYLSYIHIFYRMTLDGF